MADDSKLEVMIDGASRGNPGPAAIGVIGKKKGKTVFEWGEYIGETTNNVAEYTALIRALEEALLSGAKNIHVRADSELLVRQIQGTYRVREEKLKPLYLHAQRLIARLKIFSITHVPREKNRLTDRLANRALDDYLKKPHQPSPSPHPR